MVFEVDGPFVEDCLFLVSSFVLLHPNTDLEGQIVLVGQHDLC